MFAKKTQLKNTKVSKNDTVKYQKRMVQQKNQGSI